MSKIVPPLASAALAVLLASAVALIVVSQKPAKASYPGKNGDVVFTLVEEGWRNQDWGVLSAQVYRMNADGTGHRQLSDTPGFNQNPVWSADGKKIAFTNDREGNNLEEAYWMNADGSEETQLTDNGSPVVGKDLSFFPDYHRIAFVRWHRNPDYSLGGSLEIYVMTLDDSGDVQSLKRLTDGPAWKHDPAVSPDGKKIAFQRCPEYRVPQEGPTGVDFYSETCELYVMQAKPQSPTNRPTRLTRNDWPDAAPEWSPSGAKVAFERYSQDKDGRDIWTMKPLPVSSTNRPKNLTHTDDHASNISAVWSPDGTKIAFASTRANGGDWDIFKMDADGSHKIAITKNAGESPMINEFSPSWRPIP